jgi:hypothetical protein
MVYCDGIHLVADRIQEVHEFAKRIGLKKEWFQNKKYPHYDLTTKRMFNKALKYGAKFVSTKELIKFMRK